MAIEDAVVLGRCFACSTGTVDALQRYEDARKPRANNVLIGSRNQGLRFQHANVDDYDEEKHKHTDSIELFGYNAATVPV